MAVLVEAISVIVRRDSIDRSFDGGWRAFVSCVPNATLCTDNQLARVGFMDPKAVGKFVEGLQAAGLVFLESGKCTDIAVVDQERGPTIPCEWLEFAHIPSASPGEGFPRAGFLRDRGWRRAFISPEGAPTTPEGWTLQGSISQRFTFVPNENVGQRLKYLRTESGLDVFLDTSTGREVFKPRS